MDFFMFFTIFSYVFLVTKAFDPKNSSYVTCNDVSHEIRFPFDHPGIELSCRQNETNIYFPFYGDLVVKSISYNTRKLNLIDPKNCVPEVFLNLNLSLTPFRYYYVVKEYKYINCSSRLWTSFVQVPCLSGSNRHVYVVESSFVEPVFCRSVKRVAIPFAYSPYMSDNSFGLSLTWNLTGGEDDAANGCRFGHHEGFLTLANDKVLGLGAFILLVVALFNGKMALKKAFDMFKQKEKLSKVKADKLIAEYEPLCPTRDSKSTFEVVIH